MSTQVINGRGKLYNVDGERLIAIVSYQIWERPQTEYTLGEWWGGFILEDVYLFIQGEYMIELQDKRKGNIIITNIILRAGAFNYYQFRGTGQLA